MNESSRFSELSDEQLGSIHATCEEFELALLRNTAVSIEDQVRAANEDIRKPLFCELLAIELEVRQSREGRPDIDEYVVRFPSYDADIRRVFLRIDEPPGKIDQNSSVSASLPLAEANPPELIGRYRIEKILGNGGFGIVYRARDEHLDRTVAIKVPHANIVSRPEDANAYLAEARNVANLDHPNIVSVFDFGCDDEIPCYIVSKYVKGKSLANKLKQNRPNYRASSEMIAILAEALHYAHRKGLVHRDVKPGNILIDKDNKPFLVDFGLALREEDIGKGPKYAGTPAYMSPEQARGEGHRVDGRSDIFSLGVVFYELLVGRQPFRGDTQFELLEQVTSYEPRPIRQHDERIPRELERICRMALTKRASQRYSTAHDMAVDLRQFLADESHSHSSESDGDGSNTSAISVQASSTGSNPGGTSTRGESPDSQPITIVPKGLRSFDKDDADFFVELLPGPRDRTGLPDILRFWKIRIEETGAGATFPVGLIFGPSGCGKSSLVKAGLIPLLSDRVITVYVEATGVATESRLLNGLRLRCPDLPLDLDLAESLAAIRQGQGNSAGSKLLIVIDQFEQWLHTWKEEKNTELLQALRQLDGDRVQCIVMVRDDFWLAVSRFMHELEVDLIPGCNITLADLFDSDHARRVLRAFGRAFGRLPERTSDITNDQNAFLRQAIEGLAVDGRVVCIRLALFAEMMKGKDWTLASLKRMGGTEGVGVTFLEETFSAATAIPTHRQHQLAARAVLKSLLPDSGIDIKGQMRSYSEMLSESGYASRQKDFDELIRILDHDLRLITPADSQGMELDEDSADLDQEGAKSSLSPAGGEVRDEGRRRDSKSRYYQLTHDYLVHSLRDWLTRKKKETRRGRAEIRLAECAALWNSKPENRHLPSIWEWVTTRALSNKTSWTEPQRKMMQRADRFQVQRLSIGFVALLVVVVFIQQIVSNARHRNVVHRMQTAVEAMSNSRGMIVPRAIDDLEEYPAAMVVRELQARSADCSDSQKLALGYALAHFGSVNASFLVAEISDAPATEVNNFATALGHSRSESLNALRSAAAAADGNEDWHLKHRLAVVELHMGDTLISQEMCAIGPERDQRLSFILGWPAWHGDVSSLAIFAKQIRDPELRSGICAGIGGVRPENVTSVTMQAWNPVLSEWFQNDRTARVHSAADWLLRRWELELPRSDISTQPAAGVEWFVNSTGMTMLTIPAGSFKRRCGILSTDSSTARFLDAPLQTVKLNHSFLMSDREVSVGQFQQMMNDRDYDDREKSKRWPGRDVIDTPTADHPVQQVNWNDAALFCNWLSHKEGFSPCYQRTGQIWRIPTGEFAQLKLLEGANGYRLPTEAEWEYACRAGIETQDPFGDQVNSQLLSVYESGRKPFVSVYGKPYRAEMCGTAAPNSWGLFDLHGNVREWCHDWYAINHIDANELVNPMGPSGDTDLRRAYRDGIFHRTGIPLSVGQANLGFRVVRTIEP